MQTTDQPTDQPTNYLTLSVPQGNTGARVMGELAAHLLLKVAAQVAEATASAAAGDGRWRDGAPAVPPPMIPGNWESVSDRCFISHVFVQVR